jgi:hypothetical protein
LIRRLNGARMNEISLHLPNPRFKDCRVAEPSISRLNSAELINGPAEEDLIQRPLWKGGGNRGSRTPNYECLHQSISSFIH